jgi:hypothetical protein
LFSKCKTHRHEPAGRFECTSPAISLNVYGRLFSNTYSRAAGIMEAAFAKASGTPGRNPVAID